MEKPSCPPRIQVRGKLQRASRIALKDWIPASEGMTIFPLPDGQERGGDVTDRGRGFGPSCWQTGGRANEAGKEPATALLQALLQSLTTPGGSGIVYPNQGSLLHVIATTLCISSSLPRHRPVSPLSARSFFSRDSAINHSYRSDTLQGQ